MAWDLLIFIFQIDPVFFIFLRQTWWQELTSKDDLSDLEM